MTQHRDLTGADLHEPKGVTGAATGSVYVSNGAGSGTWKRIGNSEIDRTGLTGLTTRNQSLYHPNIKTAGKAAYATIMVPGSLIRLAGIIDAATTEDITLTFTKNGSVNIGAIVIATGSPEGSQAFLDLNPGVVFSPGEFIKVAATGGSGGVNAISANIQLVFNN